DQGLYRIDQRQPTPIRAGFAVTAVEALGRDIWMGTLRGLYKTTSAAAVHADGEAVTSLCVVGGGMTVITSHAPLHIKRGTEVSLPGLSTRENAALDVVQVVFLVGGLALVFVPQRRATGHGGQRQPEFPPDPSPVGEHEGRRRGLDAGGPTTERPPTV